MASHGPAGFSMRPTIELAGIKMPKAKREERANTGLGLVLGSGGARGLAHIGVAQVLAERGLIPDVIVGTSIGSVVGAAIAAGRMDRIERFADEIDLAKAAGLFFEFGVHRDGFIKGTRIMECLGRLLPDCAIEDLPIRYAAVATDIGTGEPVVFDKGSLLTAIRASISIPGVFTPVKRGSRQLVDGGISSPVPIITARLMGAEKVIAVNVDNGRVCPYNTPSDFGIEKAANVAKNVTARLRSSLGSRIPKLEKLLAGAPSGFGFFDIMLKTVRICEDRIALEEIETNPPDLLIEPAVGDIRTLDFTRADDAIRAGRDAAESALLL